MLAFRIQYDNFVFSICLQPFAVGKLCRERGCCFERPLGALLDGSWGGLGGSEELLRGLRMDLWFLEDVLYEILTFARPRICFLNSFWIIFLSLRFQTDTLPI